MDHASSAVRRAAGSGSACGGRGGAGVQNGPYDHKNSIVTRCKDNGPTGVHCVLYIQTKLLQRPPRAHTKQTVHRSNEWRSPSPWLGGRVAARCP